MNKILLLTLTLIIISCGRNYETMDTEKFNIDIAQNSQIKTPEELIIQYYNWPDSEGKPNLQISKREVGKNIFEIILIHDHLQDDSQKAERIIMTARKIGNKWNVDKILRSWKCYENRGHDNWGIVNCK